MASILLACPTCKKPVSSSAHSCPHCGGLLSDEWEIKGRERYKVERAVRIGCGIVILLPVAAIILVIAFSPRLTPEEQVARKRQQYCSIEGRTAAHSASRELVKQKVRSPSTATFPGGDEFVKWNGSCNFWVVGFVDSQNGFGAIVRTRYETTMTYLPDTNVWQLTDVEFERR